MGVENVMYLALGSLIAGFVALMIMPAIWRRAVRLTKKRIEAATPVSIAEFRADKDQLRAEFALETRRLEMTIESLRTRLADQLREINRRKGDLTAVRSDRDNHLTIIQELEEREGELRQRVLDLEREGADLAQRLRMRDREFADKVEQIKAMRESQHEPIEFEGERLSGDYADDVERLIELIEIERKRTRFLEEQNRDLIAELEGTAPRSPEAVAAADEMRRAIAAREGANGNVPVASAKPDLIAAEAHMADAESRLNQLLAETARFVSDGEAQPDTLLAEKLTHEEQLAHLRAKIEGVESTIASEWGTDDLDEDQLRERLGDIADDVSRVVYAVDNRRPVDGQQSLLEVVQRFADDGLRVEHFPIRAALKAKQNAPRPMQNGGGGGGGVVEHLPVRGAQNNN